LPQHDKQEVLARAASPFVTLLLGATIATMAWRTVYVAGVELDLSMRRSRAPSVFVPLAVSSREQNRFAVASPRNFNTEPELIASHQTVAMSSLVFML
jgi:hypothetical protein